MTTHDVQIVIPVYQSSLTELEQLSLRRCVEMLGQYRIVFVKPKSLDFTYWVQRHPQCAVECFDDSYFTSIVAYNRLMLSTDFYERFSASKYILIYQLDAYVFSNELANWINKDFDYVGAPWLLKKKYNRWHYRLFLQIKKMGHLLIGQPFNTTIVGNKVGNGGLSLRKIDSHLRVLREQPTKVTHFVRQSERFSSFNEDVFWATQTDFRYPTYRDAVFFSIESQPELAYEYTNGQNPFGCHGWSKPRNLPFWRTKIETE